MVYREDYKIHSGVDKEISKKISGNRLKSECFLINI